MSAPTVAPDLGDPFATPEDTKRTLPTDPTVARRGRYYLPRRDGSKKPWGWMRATNLVSAFSDQKQLQNWQTRTALAGLVARPDLYAELRALIARVGTGPDEVRAAQDEILDLAERAKDAAGGGRGRERGNRIHEITECEWRDIPYTATTGERQIVRLFAKALADAQLVPVPGMQERIVLVEEVEAVGKFDTLLRDLVSGLIHVGDTKTQKKFWTWQEVEAQLALYSHADAVWDRDAGCWVDVPVEIERTQGAALWCPPVEHSPTGGLHVEVKRLDLERGWDTVLLARRNVLRRSEAKSTKQAVSGGAWKPVDLVEVYGRRFADVATVDEGSALVRECRARGVWCPELEQSAQAAARRISAL